ncbi:MAG TPA: lipid-A-disaccharide synthase [Gemmatimonadales bacterium]|nr:lipid-A-disaccharide synthase [Gemmatimonadales bacterium]
MSRTTVFVSAGEPSGDQHAGALVAALRRLAPDVAVEGVGGSHLEAAGARLVARIEDLTVMGFVEVARKLPAHWRLLRRIERRLAQGDVRLVVLVDYPGFHLRVAAAAARAGVPVLYYIAPQLWAWHESRVHQMARTVSRLAVILPFEERFFASRGVRATFVGHPLMDRPPLAAKEQLKRELGLDPARPVLGLFPGSRRQEVVRLWPAFRDAAMRIRGERPEVQAVVAAAGGADYPSAGAIRVVAGRPRECFSAADAALCKSGTSTLEAAVAGTPLVVAYRMHPLSYLLARRLVRVPWIGMVNLVAERQVAPEFIQGAVTAGALADAVRPLLDPSSPERRAQLEALAEVRRRLGNPGAAVRAAELARSLLVA